MDNREGLGSRGSFGGTMTVEFFDGRSYTILDANDFVLQLWNSSYLIWKTEQDYMRGFAARCFKAFQLSIDASSADTFLADLVRYEIVFLHGPDA